MYAVISELMIKFRIGSLQKLMTKALLVQFAGAFFGAFFAAMIAIFGTRLASIRESNKNYRDELTMFERFDEFLLIEINTLLSEVENIFLIISENRIDSVPNLSFNILSQLPESNILKSKILNIDILSRLGDQQFHIRYANKIINNWNQMNLEVRGVVISQTDKPHMAETYKRALLSISEGLIALQIVLRTVKNETQTVQAEILSLLDEMPRSGILFYLVRFTRYRPKRLNVKKHYMQIIDRHLRKNG